MRVFAGKLRVRYKSLFLGLGNAMPMPDEGCLGAGGFVLKILYHSVFVFCGQTMLFKTIFAAKSG